MTGSIPSPRESARRAVRRPPNLVGLGLDDWFMQSASGVNESFLRDALGSTIALTDSSRTIQEQYTYDPYGNTSLSGSGGSNNYFQFTGREDDYASLYYMRSRYYNPAIARFMSRDPAGFAGGLNMYAYAGDDPVDFSDPTGMDWESILEGPGDTCSACTTVGPGWYAAPQFPFPAPVPTIGGIDADVVPFYHGQNGGGLLLATQKDKWYGYNERSFRRWMHRQVKGKE